MIVVSISRPPSIQPIAACLSPDHRSVCPISQSVGPLPNFGLRSCLLVLVVGAVWTWWRGRGTCSNWLFRASISLTNIPIGWSQTQLWVVVFSPGLGCESGVDLVARTVPGSSLIYELVNRKSVFQCPNWFLQSFDQFVKYPNISWSWPHLWVAVLGVGAVWTWWRGQPGIRDLYLWIKVSANHCHHHHRHHDHHFQRSYLQNWQKKGNAVLSGYVVSFICVSNQYCKSWGDFKREEGRD